MFGMARHAQGAIRQNTFLKYRKSGISPVLSFFFKQMSPPSRLHQAHATRQTKLSEFVRPVDRLAGAGTDCYFDESNTTLSVPHLCESHGGQAIACKSPYLAWLCIYGCKTTISVFPMFLLHIQTRTVSCDLKI